MTKKLKGEKSGSKTKVLYMSERGQVGCLQPGHAPHQGSDTWVFDRWQKLTTAEASALAKELGHAVECEVCRADAHRLGAEAPAAEVGGEGPAREAGAAGATEAGGSEAASAETVRPPNTSSG